MKRLIAFDLDGTLAVSKQAIDAEMAMLLVRLCASADVAVMSGGDWPQFEAQLIARLPEDIELSRLFLLPTSGTKLYRNDGEWRQVYAEEMSESERRQIVSALESVVASMGIENERSWGERIEDRRSQITFSGLGQLAPPDVKLAWDLDRSKRGRIQAMLAPMVRGFTVRIGGSTSVDITRDGADKGYGIVKLSQAAEVPLADMLFVGDALYPGGNDHAVCLAGVDCVAVRDVEETKRIIETILFCRQ